MLADDVMIFFDGGSSSLHDINETRDDFAGWSGLIMNRDKTELFLGGVDEVESMPNANYVFSRADLPIRYLGLSLMCRKLKNAEFAPLGGENKGQVLELGSENTFAGRHQLIASVITGTVVF